MWKTEVGFRPLGVSYFQKLLYELRKVGANVSVPSRGILFPKGGINNVRQKEFYKVSVPSRGILFPKPDRQSPLFYWLF